MVRNRLTWLAKCALLSIAGVLLAGRVADTLFPPVWWLAHVSGATTLSRGMFVGRHYFELMALIGFLLGLVPFHHLQALSASILAHFHHRPAGRNEFDISRPTLWAWAPSATVLLLRFLTFDAGADTTVLGRTYYAHSRWQHFFGPISLLSLDANPSAWIFDRFVLTGPTLFLLAYSAGVIARHSLPSHPSVATELEPTPTTNPH